MKRSHRIVVQADPRLAERVRLAAQATDLSVGGWVRAAIRRALDGIDTATVLTPAVDPAPPAPSPTEPDPERVAWERAHRRPA